MLKKIIFIFMAFLLSLNIGASGFFRSIYLTKEELKHLDRGIEQVIRGYNRLLEDPVRYFKEKGFDQNFIKNIDEERKDKAYLSLNFIDNKIVMKDSESIFSINYIDLDKGEISLENSKRFTISYLFDRIFENSYAKAIPMPRASFDPFTKPANWDTDINTYGTSWADPFRSDKPEGSVVDPVIVPFLSTRAQKSVKDSSEYGDFKATFSNMGKSFFREGASPEDFERRMCGKVRKNLLERFVGDLDSTFSKHKGKIYVASALAAIYFTDSTHLLTQISQTTMQAILAAISFGGKQIFHLGKAQIASYLQNSFQKEGAEGEFPLGEILGSGDSWWNILKTLVTSGAIAYGIKKVSDLITHRKMLAGGTPLYPNLAFMCEAENQSLNGYLAELAKRENFEKALIEKAGIKEDEGIDCEGDEVCMTKQAEKDQSWWPFSFLSQIKDKVTGSLDGRVKDFLRSCRKTQDTCLLKGMNTNLYLGTNFAGLQCDPQAKERRTHHVGTSTEENLIVDKSEEVKNTVDINTYYNELASRYNSTWSWAKINKDDYGQIKENCLDDQKRREMGLWNYFISKFKSTHKMEDNIQDEHNNICEGHLRWMSCLKKFREKMDYFHQVYPKEFGEMYGCSRVN